MRYRTGAQERFSAYHIGGENVFWYLGACHHKPIPHTSPLELQSRVWWAKLCDWKTPIKGLAAHRWNKAQCKENLHKYMSGTAHRTLTVARTRFRPYSDKGEIHMPCVTIKPEKTRQMMKPCRRKEHHVESETLPQNQIQNRCTKMILTTWYYCKPRERQKRHHLLGKHLTEQSTYTEANATVFELHPSQPYQITEDYTIKECPEQDVFITERKEQISKRPFNVTLSLFRYRLQPKNPWYSIHQIYIANTH